MGGIEAGVGGGVQRRRGAGVVPEVSVAGKGVFAQRLTGGGEEVVDWVELERNRRCGKGMETDEKRPKTTETDANGPRSGGGRAAVQSGEAFHCALGRLRRVERARPQAARKGRVTGSGTVAAVKALARSAENSGAAPGRA